jgi:hypothetical protein
MIDRIVTITGAALALVMVAGPAMAVAAVAVPEPATMTLFGLGAAGAFIAKRFVGRK